MINKPVKTTWDFLKVTLTPFISLFPKAWDAKVSVAPKAPIPNERQNVLIENKANPRAANEALLTSWSVWPVYIKHICSIIRERIKFMIHGNDYFIDSTK